MPVRPSRAARIIVVLSGLALFAGCIHVRAPATLVSTPVGPHQVRAASGAAVQVRVFNYARLSASALTEALTTADGLLHQAGLVTEWVTCTPGGSPPRACYTPLPADGLALRLLAAAPETTAVVGRRALGFAAQDHLGVGVMSTVYHDRVERLARASGVDPARLVGLVATHELGHLLLRTRDHGPRGVMQAGWSAADLQQVPVTAWRFSLDERTRLQTRTTRPAPVPTN